MPPYQRPFGETSRGTLKQCERPPLLCAEMNVRQGRRSLVIFALMPSSRYKSRRHTRHFADTAGPRQKSLNQFGAEGLTDTAILGSSASLIAGTLPRAPKNSPPFAIDGLEGRLEPIPDEFSPEGLKAYRRPNRAVFINSSVDVGRIMPKLCLAYDNLAFYGEFNNGSLASLII